MILTDHLNRTTEFHPPFHRIISLCPSQTELLFDLGLGHSVIGITGFCIHPKEAVKSKIYIGGTKNPKLELIKSLQPDLILAEKEENIREHIETLAEDFPVYVTNVESYEDAIKMIRDVGTLTLMSSKGEAIALDIEKGFSRLTPLPLKVLYFIWKKPYMTAGENTYINSLINKCGWENVGIRTGERYPVWETFGEISPDYVLLSSEPYPFAAKHIIEFQSLFPKARIEIIDGEMFSWYGSRMIKAANYLAELNSKLAVNP